MSLLADLQRRFLLAMLKQDSDLLAQAIVPNGLEPARRIQIYRNNIHSNLTVAMENVYPVVRNLVGEGFFSTMVREYIAEHPSTSGNLHGFGQAFASFLENYISVKSLPYLPDVARFEWACDEAYHAADSQPFDMSALSKVNQDEYGRLRFHLHPAVRLLTSTYPVFHIWQVNQAEYNGDTTVYLDEGEDHLLLMRRGLNLVIERLEPAEFQLLNNLYMGMSLGDAYVRVLALDQNLDLKSILGTRIEDLTLVGFQTGTY